MIRIAFFLLVAFAGTAYSQNITLRSLLTTPGETCAGVWGYVDSLGNEYALLGASKGLKVVNVTNPDSVYVVKVFPGPNNLWREIRTWRGFAYVTTEATSIQGLQIIDLRNLPDTTNLPVKYWSTTIGGTPLSSIHALELADGFVYLYGSNIGNGGALIADLADPWNPVLAGQYTAGGYIHDGYVRNDTMYPGHIYAGVAAIVDVTSKSNPQLVSSQVTPNKFTHNTWLSDNSKYLFTTDEVDNSYLTSYDIRDKQNITELDRFQAFPGNNSVVHNVLIKNDYAVVSWYKDGVVIADAHRPENLVLVGNYDTYAGTGGGYLGNWSVYPFLPSGNILATGIEEGLFVLTPAYKRACYLEGTVTDSLCNRPLDGVTVEITGTTVMESTTSTGVFKTGYYVPGTYNVTFSKAGFNSKTVTVTLDTGVVTNVQLKMYSPSTVSLQGTTKESSTSSSIRSVMIDILSQADTLQLTSSNAGTFSMCGNFGQYSAVHAAKWGYQEICLDSVEITSTSSQLDLSLPRGYKDDFHFDLGWTVSSSPTVTAGSWVRGTPVGFPSGDVTTDCSNKAFVTGNSAALEDLDGGYTRLTSPVMDMTIYDDPTVEYSRFFNCAIGTPLDTFMVTITNGIATDTLEMLVATQGTWTHKSFRVKDYVSLTPNVKVSFYVHDGAGDNRVEAAIDAFSVTGLIVEDVNEIGSSPVLIYPNPSNGKFTVQTKNETPLDVKIYDLSGKAHRADHIISGEGITISSDLAAGTYMLKVIFRECTITSKIIIQ